MNSILNQNNNFLFCHINRTLIGMFLIALNSFGSTESVLIVCV